MYNNRYNKEQRLSIYKNVLQDYEEQASNNNRSILLAGRFCRGLCNYFDYKLEWMSDLPELSIEIVILKEENKKLTFLNVVTLKRKHAKSGYIGKPGDLQPRIDLLKRVIKQLENESN